MSKPGNSCEVCGGAALAGSKYCLFHDMEQTRQKAANKAFSKGDTMEGLLNVGLGFLAGAVGQEVRNPQRVQQARFFYKMQQQARAQARAQQAAQAEEDPFAILGLDASTACEKDVRQIQRKLAGIWHSGDQESPAAQERMKRFNQAADECIRVLQGRVNPDSG